MHLLRSLLGSMFALAALASLLHAQSVVTGTVLQPNGQPLANVDLDFYFANGDEQKNVSGDFTGPTGVFTTLIPPGTYTIELRPPAGFLYQDTVVGPFVVSGVTNVGPLSLLAGAGVKGVLKNTNLVPLGNSKVRPEIAGTGVPVAVNGAGTDPSTGAFQFVVAPGTYDLLLDTTGDGTLGAPGQILGKALPVSVMTDLGTILLPPGQILSATVVRQTGGTPVADCDVDVRDPVTLQKLYTPNDNSDAFGFVDVVVPAGTWILDVAPDFATSLVAKRVSNVVVAGPTPLGVIALETGVVLSGTVRDGAGALVAGVDVDVQRWPSGAFVLTTDDDTNASGAYQVIVPATALQIAFRPFETPALGVQTHAPQTIAGPTVVHSLLPKATAVLPSHYGAGHPGTGGLVPTVSDFGIPMSTFGHYGFLVEQGLPSTPASVMLAEASGFFPLPDFDVVFLIDLLTINSLNGATDANGRFLVNIVVPPIPQLVGEDFFVQALLFDPGASKLFTHSDGLRVVLSD